MSAKLHLHVIFFMNKKHFSNAKSQENHFSLSALLDMSDYLDIEKIINKLGSILSRNEIFVPKMVEDL